MRNATLCFLVDGANKRVLLGMKKRGFGAGKWNGFGGKVHDGESIEDATAREMLEESSVRVGAMAKAGELTFTFPHKPEWDQVVHVFLARAWESEPVESEEMLPKWFEFSDVPYSSMWQDDAHWLPKVLGGKKVTASFSFKPDGESIDRMQLKEL